MKFHIYLLLFIILFFTACRAPLDYVDDSEYFLSLIEFENSEAERLYDLGIEAYDNDFLISENYLLKSLEYEDNDLTNYDLSYLYFNDLENYNKSVYHCNKLINSIDENIVENCYYLLSISYSKLNDSENTFYFWNKLVELDHFELEYYLFYERILNFNLGEFEKNILILNKLKSEDLSDDLFLNYELALNYAELKKYDLAIENINYVIENDYYGDFNNTELLLNEFQNLSLSN